MAKNLKFKMDPAFLCIATERMRPRRARRLITRSGQRSRGVFRSAKSTELVMYESQLELAACRVLEVASVVHRFGTQPARLAIEDREGEFQYTPDLFLVADWKETVASEVKPDALFLRPQTLDRLRRVTAVFAQQASLFVVLLESDLKPDADFQDDLAKVLSTAPWPRWRPDAGPSSASVVLPVDDGAFSEKAWLRAQAICDDILRKVMDRSFDATVRAAQAAVER